MKKLEFRKKEQEDLFNNNIGFAINLANEWNKKCAIDREELQSYALESLCIAAVNYDVLKCDKFLNYASIIINTNIRRELKRRNTKKSLAAINAVGFEDESELFEDYNNDIAYNSLLISVDTALNDYQEIQKQVIKKYLIDRMTLKQISEEFNISMRTVHKWVLKGKEDLKEKLSN